MHCRANARVIFRRDQRDFAPVDFRLQVAYGVVIHLEGGDATQRTLHQFPRISTDEWHRPFAHVRPNLAKLVEGRGVEGRGFDVSCDIKLRQSLRISAAALTENVTAIVLRGFHALVAHA